MAFSTRTPWIRDLPPPPLPTLTSTLERYLEGIEAVVPKAGFEKTTKIVADFAKNDGPILQKLVERQASKEENWATTVWLPDMYLKNPTPLPINQSAFFLFPCQTFKTSRDQIAFTAELIIFALHFQHLIETEELKQDFSRAIHAKSSPLCMETYKNFFNSYRRPGVKIDYQLPKRNEVYPQCIVIVHRKQFYRLNLEKETTVTYIASALLNIRSSTSVSDSPHVGVLTTQPRAQWAVHYELLRKENPGHIEALEQCLLVLCLDDALPPTLSGPTKAEQCENLLHGKGININSCNRWYDKTLQVVVGADGICGVVMEHSQSEGITLLRFMEMFLEDLRSTSREPIDWSCTGVTAERFLCYRAVEDVDLYVLHFNEFGKEFPKSQNISPDVFVQLALQLTYYKVHRKLVSTYESASLRRFRLGRADNIRAATREAYDWVRAICDDSNQHLTLGQKQDLFRRAVAKQTAILKYTIGGMAPDNHLLALRETARKLQLRCKLFEDSSYKEFLNFQLSTSQLPNESRITVGYGAVVPHGYGCSYTINANDMLFCVTSFFSASVTSSDFFALSLEGSLNQVRELCTTTVDASSAKPTRATPRNGSEANK
ncbi:choline O-acetyltransferase-like [Varroa destructor]|uniref:Choline O-acetyltransferase n=1 Tax=Varroa destructor TaxID=109461 RepID=A0A7M7JSH3_VARDE|nr:choline O-acetyltransferase-like [Varroa destructor]